ncbi:MAG: PBP1A family penicillin-binding protein [Ignavibacteriales bacterium]|nr:PBP1A family penicillin-binding protein [Ignavibacteriales bacterium]
MIFGKKTNKPVSTIPDKLKEKRRKTRKKIIWTIIGIFFFLIVAFFWHVISGLPSLEDLENPKQSLASTVYSADGVVLDRFFIQRRIEINLNDLPDYCIKALLDTEDRKFYDHWGVDLERFVKAMFKTVFLFKTEGASTITQQLARGLYQLKEEDDGFFGTVVRKVREWITAVQIERNYTKDEILEMYLNQAYLGQGAYGVGMAAKMYFNKDVKDLSLSEFALLVALQKSGVYYDPYRNPNTALQRRNLVLHNMVVVGDLGQETYDRLKEEPIKLLPPDVKKEITNSIAPHFVEYIRQQMEKWCKVKGYNLYEDGLNIYTTLDSRMQKIANESVDKHLENAQKTFDKSWSWDKNKDLLTKLVDKAIKERSEYTRTENEDNKKKIYNYLKGNIAFVDSVQKANQKVEVGFVVLDIETGEIKAMVGGQNRKMKHGLNHVTQIIRQPGSAFKPIIYTVAIDRGLYPAFPLLDQRFIFGNWEPRNANWKVSGEFMTLRSALKHSVNIIAARLVVEDYAPLVEVGNYANRMGIKTPLNLTPAISLGASEVSPLELTSAYATIGNRGIYNEPYGIVKIEDANGILLEYFTPKSYEAISEETAYIMVDMMKDVINGGTGSRIRGEFGFKYPAVGKTGTTSDFADAWFVGFTPKLAAGVWVGFDDRRIKFTSSFGYGGTAALPVWGLFMKRVYDEIKLPTNDFKAPSSGNIITVTFCKESIYTYGDPKLISDDCKEGGISDIINKNNIPDEYDASRDKEIKSYYDVRPEADSIP